MAETIADMRERLCYLVTGYCWWWWRDQIVWPSLLWLAHWPRNICRRWQHMTRRSRCAVCRRVFSAWFTVGSIGGSAGEFCSERCYLRRWPERRRADCVAEVR